jgi:hypothetical protein
MTGAERQRLYIARREAKAAAAALASKPAPTPTPLVAPAAASAPPPPSRSLPKPRLAASLEPEREGISDCERLIELGWSFGRIERYLGAARLRASQSASQSPLIRDSILDSNLGIRVRGARVPPPQQRVRQLSTAAAGSDATH